MISLVTDQEDLKGQIRDAIALNVTVAHQWHDPYVDGIAEAVNDVLDIVCPVLSDHDDTLRRVYGPDDEGVYVEAKLTDEGVIVDVFNDDEFLYSFARTWTEYIDHATETP